MLSFTTNGLSVDISMYASRCVCVREREKERERKNCVCLSVCLCNTPPPSEYPDKSVCLSTFQHWQPSTWPATLRPQSPWGNQSRETTSVSRFLLHYSLLQVHFIITPSIAILFSLPHRSTPLTSLCQLKLHRLSLVSYFGRFLNLTSICSSLHHWSQWLHGLSSNL